ncbi:acyl-CoA dehydrogenase family protein [Streptomyces sp. INA 01156]
MTAFSLEPEQLAWCERLRALAAGHLRPLAEKGEPGRVNRPLVAALGTLGLLPRLFTSGALDLCLMRESLAHGCTEAETALALQGLGAHPVHAHGAEALRPAGCPGWRTARRSRRSRSASRSRLGRGGALPDRRPGRPGRWRLTGEKRWISNAPEADFYTVFARTTPGAGAAA